MSASDEAIDALNSDIQNPSLLDELNKERIKFNTEIIKLPILLFITTGGGSLVLVGGVMVAVIFLPLFIAVIIEIIRLIREDQREAREELEKKAKAAANAH